MKRKEQTKDQAKRLRKIERKLKNVRVGKSEPKLQSK